MGSIPITRSKNGRLCFRDCKADCRRLSPHSSVAEHFLGKEEVPGSNPGVGSTKGTDEKEFCLDRSHESKGHVQREI